MVMIDISQVAKCFAQAQKSYNPHAIAQLQVAQHLDDLIQIHTPIKKLHNVLEIGCGSGFFSQLMLKYAQLQQIYLNDLYVEVQQHFAQDPRFQWYIGDIEQLDLPQSLDGVFSCSALQWIKDFEKLCRRIHSALCTGGYFCFASYGEQNLKEIKALTGQGLSYQTYDQILDNLEKIGFEVEYQEQQLIELHFEHPHAVLKHIKATGVHATAQGFRWTKSSLNQFYKNYQMFIDQNTGQYILTYHPVWFVVRKK